MINLNHLTAKRGNFQIEIAALQLQKGELVAVLGNNGSGKSTFLSMLAGFLDYQGQFGLHQKEFASYSQREKSRQIGLLPQKTELNMPFDAYYVILTGRFPHTNGLRYSKKDHQATAAVINQFDIRHLQHRPFNELSGGEKQRVLLARTINHETPVVLLDEPLNGIDLKHQHETIRFLQMIKQDKVVLTVMHDLALAVRECDRFLVFTEGKLIYDTKQCDLDSSRLAEIFQVRIEFLKQNGKLFVHTGTDFNDGCSGADLIT